MKRLIAILLLGGWLLTGVYTIDETESAVVTRLDRVTAVWEKAGLYTKLPWPIDRVTRIDNRKRAFLGDADEFITLDGHNILVAAYVVWRVDQPVKFLTSVQSQIPAAEKRLSFHLSGQLGSLLGETNLSDLVREATGVSHEADLERSGAAIRSLSEQLKENLAAVGREEYGIEVIDARIRRLNFPDDNRTTIFDRMKAARQELINRYTADGERQAAMIESAARKEADIIRAKGKEEAKTISGQAEADAARIYNEAIERDPEFYDFVQRLETVRSSFKEGDTIVIPADWDLSRAIFGEEEGAVGK